MDVFTMYQFFSDFQTILRILSVVLRTK